MCYCGLYQTAEVGADTKGRTVKCDSKLTHTSTSEFVYEEGGNT